MALSATPWFLYLLECQSSAGKLSLYAGISTDPQRRFAEHVAGTGARYTRANPPLRILTIKRYPDRSEASRAEAALKKLPREHKLAFFDPSKA